MDKIIITVFGLGLCLFIYYFFFSKKEKAAAVSAELNITVDGGYQPSQIRIPKDKKVKLTFIRKDKNSCLEEIVFPDYKIKVYLPLDIPVTITLDPPHPKNSTWHCAMDMFYGRITAV